MAVSSGHIEKPFSSTGFGNVFNSGGLTMRYNRHYMEETREKNDEQAIKDIKEYLSATQWDTLMQLVGALNSGHPDYTFQHINVGLGFTGIDGYPTHAFGRKYCLEKYKEWMTTGDDAVKVDEQGFSLEDE